MAGTTDSGVSLRRHAVHHTAAAIGEIHAQIHGITPTIDAIDSIIAKF